MVVASGQKRLPCWRTQSCGVEPVELQATGRKLLRVGRLAWSTKGAGRTEASIIYEDEQNIGRTRRWPQVPDRRILGVRIFGIVSCQTDARHIRDGENSSLNLVLVTHRRHPFRATMECRRDNQTHSRDSTQDRTRALSRELSE